MPADASSVKEFYHRTPSPVPAQALPHSGESLRFGNGAWLQLECWRDARRPQAPLLRLFFQRRREAMREALGEVSSATLGAGALHAAHTQLLCGGDRCALVLGQYVFQRWERAQGPYWYRATTGPFGAAAFFLRAYWCRHERRGSADRGLSLPEVPYLFGHLDLERNVLVTRQAGADRRFPQFLVYSAAAYGTPWTFDAARTRRVNGIGGAAAG